MEVGRLTFARETRDFLDEKSWLIYIDVHPWFVCDNCGKLTTASVILFWNDKVLRCFVRLEKTNRCIIYTIIHHCRRFHHRYHRPRVQ